MRGSLLPLSLLASLGETSAHYSREVALEVKKVLWAGVVTFL